MRFLMWCIGAVFLLGSCVSNKKFALMQKDDVNKKGLPTDTVLRSYDVQDYEYRIQAEDILSVTISSLTPKDFDFFNQNQLQTGGINLEAGGGLLIGELVDMQGEIQFPFIGKVKVSGLSVFEVQAKLQELSKQYLDDPVVKVRLINFRLTLLGEVAREGTVNLRNNRVNMLEALGQAGGLTDLADRANIKLIRQKNGKTEIQYINLLDEKFINSHNFYVHQNDVLIVPPLRQRPYRRYFGQNLSLVISTLSLILLTVNLISK